MKLRLELTRLERDVVAHALICLEGEWTETEYVPREERAALTRVWKKLHSEKS